MIGLTLPRRKRLSLPGASVPRIDWTNPLMRGLFSCAISVGGEAIDIVSGAKGSGSLQGSQRGVGIKGGTLSGFNGWALGSPPYSIVVYGERLSNFSGLKNLAGTADGGANVNGAYIQIENPNGGAIFFQWAIWNAGARNFVANSANYNWPEGPKSFGLVVPSNIVAKMYYSGALDSSNTITSGACGNNSTLTIGDSTYGQMLYALTWKRAVADWELASLALDPFGFLIFPEDDLIQMLAGVVSGGAAATTSYLPLMGCG